MVAADEWKCTTCSCEWKKSQKECGSCGALQPGISQEDIDNEKKAVVNAFLGGGGGSNTGGSVFGGAGSSNGTESKFTFGTGGGGGGGSLFGNGTSNDKPTGGAFTFGTGNNDSGGASIFVKAASPAKAAPAVSGGGGGFVFNAAAAAPKKGINEELAEKYMKHVKGPTDRSGATSEVFVVGSGECEQLGLGDDILERKKPAIVKALNSVHVKTLAVGAFHTIVLTADGLAYSWGCNDDGALGRKGEENVPLLIDSLADKRVFLAQVSCGDCHSAFVDKDANAWIVGSYKDSSGHIGFTEFKTKKSVQGKKTHIPQKVIFDGYKGKVKSISSGDHHTLALMDDGSLYSWGQNQLGQCGHTGRTPEPPTSKREDPDEDIEWQKQTALWKEDKVARLFPRRMVLPHGVKSSQILGANASADCTFMWTKSDSSQILGANASADCTFMWTKSDSYACGLNGDGQLGVGKMCESEDELVKVNNLSGLNIKTISGGGSHSMALTVDGILWGWGRTERTGIDNSAKAFADPKELSKDLFGGCVPISLRCGSTHNCVVTRNGDVFFWGSGETNQLANVPRDVSNFEPVEKDEEGRDEQFPYMVTSSKLKDKFVLMADGGAQHSVILAWDGSTKRRAAQPGTPDGIQQPSSKRWKRICVMPEVAALAEARLREVLDDSPDVPQIAIDVGAL
eukprot:gene161-182_t